MLASSRGTRPRKRPTIEAKAISGLGWVAAKPVRKFTLLPGPYDRLPSYRKTRYAAFLMSLSGSAPRLCAAKPSCGHVMMT
jgi:hypothetical protein